MGIYMRYLPTAFAQLEFSWKLYGYALDGKLDRQELDIPQTFKDGKSMLVLPDQIFHSDKDLLLALENNLTIAYGAAAITLNRSREEADIKLPKELLSEADICVWLIYHIRNAFAHDIAEPKWEIRNKTLRIPYIFAGVEADLTNVHQEPFKYTDLGGLDAIFIIRDYALSNIIG